MALDSATNRQLQPPLAESPAVICVNTYDDNPSRTVDLGHYTLWKICLNLILQLCLTNEDYTFEDILSLCRLLHILQDDLPREALIL